MGRTMQRGWMPLQAKKCCTSLFQSKAFIFSPRPLVFKGCFIRVHLFPYLVVVFAGDGGGGGGGCGSGRVLATFNYFVFM